MFKRSRSNNTLICVIVLLSLCFSLSVAQEDDFTSHFDRALFGLVSYSNWSVHNNNFADLNVNCFFTVPSSDFADLCSQNDYFWISMNTQRGTIAYAADPGTYPAPSDIFEWRSSLSGYITDSDNRVGHNLGEEGPELYDKIFFEASNYYVREEIPDTERIYVVGNLSAIRPDYFLSVEDLDAIWVYPYPFNNSYEPGSAGYQDSLQKRCVDYYNLCYNKIAMMRDWGVSPNLQMKVFLQTWYKNVDPEENPEATRQPTHKEIVCEGWIAFSRGAKGLGAFKYDGTTKAGGFGGLIFDSDPNARDQVMFDGLADIYGKLEAVDDNLRDESTYNYENGLTDVDVDTFRSFQGDMNSPLYFVQRINVTPQMGSEEDVYSELSIHSSSYGDDFFLIFNRSLHTSKGATYRITVSATKHGSGENWRLVDLITGEIAPKVESTDQNFTVEFVLYPSEARFFILEYTGTPSEQLLTNSWEATGFSNARKLVLGKRDGSIWTYIAYTDESIHGPHIDYAVSNDMGQNWDVHSGYISHAENPALAIRSNGWPIMVYYELGQGSERTYYVKDCRSGEAIPLATCGGGGGPPSIALHQNDELGNDFECHVAFYDSRKIRLCHYVIDEGDFTDVDPYLELDELFLPVPCWSRKPSVVCDSTGQPYIFFAYDDSPNGIHNEYIYVWDGESDEAIRLTFAEGWDPTVFIQDPALLLTWVAPDQCTYPRGEIHAKRGLIRYNGPWWPEWPNYTEYEEVDPNVDMGEVQPLGPNAALWQSQVVIHASYRDDVGRDPTNPWTPRITLDYGRYPQSAYAPDIGLFATAWTKGSTVPYSIETNIDNLESMIPGETHEVDVLSPDGGERWYAGENRPVMWTSSYENKTDSWDWYVYLSTDSGYTWPYEYRTKAKDLECRGGHLYIWNGFIVENVNSSECLIKIEYQDQPLGYPCDISRQTFTINNGSWWPQEEDNNYVMGVNPPGVEKDIYWENYSTMGMQGVDLEYSLDDGETWSSQFAMMLVGTLDPPDDSLLIDTIFGETDTSYLYMYWGTLSWTIPNTPSSAAKVRLVAYDSLSNSSTSTQEESFVIPMPGGWAYNTSTNQDVWSLNDAGDKMGLFYTGFNYADSTKPIIYYTESADGYSLNIPDSIAIGTFPCHQDGEAFWLSTMKDTIYRSYWDEAIPYWSTPNVMFTGDPIVDSIRHSPIGIDIDADTVHIIFEKRICDDPGYDQLRLLHASLLRESSTLIGPDTIYTPITSGPQNSEAPSIQADAGDVYISYWKDGFCSFIERTPLGQFMFHQIGVGYQPTLSLSEGNIIYNYISSNSRSLIRLWRYRDDTVWAGCDTFTLNDEVDLLTSQHGILYSTQVADTTISRTYLYDPLGQRLIQRSTRDGSYPHSYLWKCSDDQWTECYTGYLDTFRFVKTETNDLNAFFPALYQEADHRRSPYTSYRDTCVEYDPCLVDYGADSLVYGFNRLDPTRSYRLLVEFYFESATADTIRILANLGGFTDTVEVPNNTFVWHAFDLPPGSGFNLHLYPLDLADYVTVSRLTVGQIDPSHLLMLCGAEEEEEIPISFCLFQPLPNPFTDFATIRYSIPYATRVKLKVYDVVGRQVAELVDGEVDAGVHTLTWEGRDDIGRRCASGIYFVYFTAEDYIGAKKVVLIK